MRSNKKCILKEKIYRFDNIEFKTSIWQKTGEIGARGKGWGGEFVLDIIGKRLISKLYKEKETT